MSHYRTVVEVEPGGDGPISHSWQEECPGTFGDRKAIIRQRAAVLRTLGAP